MLNFRGSGPWSLCTDVCGTVVRKNMDDWRRGAWQRKLLTHGGRRAKNEEMRCQGHNISFKGMFPSPPQNIKPSTSTADPSHSIMIQGGNEMWLMYS